MRSGPELARWVRFLSVFFILMNQQLFGAFSFWPLLLLPLLGLNSFRHKYNRLIWKILAIKKGAVSIDSTFYFTFYKRKLQTFRNQFLFFRFKEITFLTIIQLIHPIGMMFCSHSSGYNTLIRFIAIRQNILLLVI